MEIFHVVPKDDIYKHKEIGYDCNCNPDVEFADNQIIVTHNAFDGRDLIEEVEGL
jgi:hypothetical protein